MTSSTADTSGVDSPGQSGAGGVDSRPDPKLQPTPVDSGAQPASDGAADLAKAVQRRNAAIQRARQLEEELAALKPKVDAIGSMESQLSQYREQLDQLQAQGREREFVDSALRDVPLSKRAQAQLALDGWIRRKGIDFATIENITDIAQSASADLRGAAPEIYVTDPIGTRSPVESGSVDFSQYGTFSEVPSEIVHLLKLPENIEHARRLTGQFITGAYRSR